jgi:hypothetical protein
MEVRVVKFNIKQFIEDYIFCVECKDKCGEKDALERFNKVFSSSSHAVQDSMQMYLFNSAVARDYPKLVELATKSAAFCV